MGHNEGWKQRTNMGPVNNQKFIQIPFNMLISMIKYKAEEAGIRTIVIDESHTSKSYFLDSEKIEHHNEYEGKRILRGLFRSISGTRLKRFVNMVNKFHNLMKGPQYRSN